MTVRIYRSTDASAPSLTGQAGSLLTLLDAVLVGTAGVAYGSVSSAGWSKPYSNTGNIGIYRMATSGNSGFHLHIDDSGTGNTAKEAIACGAESASALNTLTSVFPTASQLALNASSTPANTGVVIRKSNTADATARAWTIIADGSLFYMFVETGDLTNPVISYPFVFGDIFSYKASDAYKCIIVGRNAVNSNSGAAEALADLFQANAQMFSWRMTGHYMPRHWTGVGGSIGVGHHIDQWKVGALGGNVTSNPNDNTANGSTGNLGIIGNYGIASGLAQAIPYPNGPDGGLLMSPIWLAHHSAFRGYFKGLWAPLHHRPFMHGDTFSGSGNLAGKSFIVMDIPGAVNGGSTVAGQIFVEYSNTWS